MAWPATPTATASDIAISLYNVSTDQLGAPRIIARQSDETIAWRWDSAEVFGATSPDQNPSSLGTFSFNQRLPGQMFDAESGLFQNWNREYNPRIGRYMQSDPIGLQGGINTFAYVESDPLSGIDPEGLAPPPAVRGAPPTGSVSAAYAGPRVVMLLNQIRVYNPTYSYQMIRASSGPGSGYTNADVSALMGILRGYQNAQVCTRGSVTAGRFIADQRGNVMLEPVGGSTVSRGQNGADTHTLFPNGSNFQRLNPIGHPNNPTPHGHGHLMGTGSGQGGQGPSLDVNGNVVPFNSGAAHWPIN